MYVKRNNLLSRFPSPPPQFWGYFAPLYSERGGDGLFLHELSYIPCRALITSANANVYPNILLFCYILALMVASRVATEPSHKSAHYDIVDLSRG